MQKGFTLVETLVAITVLLLVVIGPMTVAQRGIQNAYYATEQTTAVFLAQEAIEAVRELRDDAALDTFDNGNTDSWQWVLDVSGCDTENGCAYTGTGFERCDLYNDCQLRVDLQTGKYTHDYCVGSYCSPFTRRVFITNHGDAAEVNVTVSWDNRIFSSDTAREVVLRTWIYDHYQRFEDN